MNQNRIEANIKMNYWTLTIAFLIVPLQTSTAQQPFKQKPLSLANAVRIAIQNNPDLLLEKESLAEIEAQVGVAKSDFYPTLSFSSDYRRFSSVSNSDVYNKYTTGFSARQYLFRRGKTRTTVERSNLNYQVSDYQYQTHVQDLVLRVTEAYYRLLQRQRLVRVAEQTVERTMFQLKEANARFEAGLASHSDILKTQVEHSNASLNLIRAKNDELYARGLLNNLLGRRADTPMLIVDDLGKEIEKAELNFDTLSKAAIRNRPENNG